MEIKLYNEFHGNIKSDYIGKRLREIVSIERKTFKILTGHGSQTGLCKSKPAAIKSLTKMKKEGLIKGFILGEFKYELLDNKSLYCQDKLKYSSLVKDDPHYGNIGIIFVIV